MLSGVLKRYSPNGLYMLLFLLGACSLLLIDAAKGQESDLESLLEAATESDDQAELMEHLKSLLDRPMDINRASEDDLQTLPWISPALAQAIITRRKKYGAFTNPEELLQIEGMETELFQIVRPYLQVGKRADLPSIGLRGRHRIYQRVEKGRGYLDGTYPGGREKFYNRVTGSVGDFLHLGFLAEKDAGEQDVNDLMLGYGSISVPHLRSRIVLGHFLVEAGQGLVFWGPYSLGKGSDPLAPGKQRSRGIHAYASSDENTAFSGAAMTSSIGAFSLTALHSRSYLDASVEGDSVQSLPNTGLHRTGREIEQRDALGETVTGLIANWQPRPGLKFGLNYQSSHFSQPIAEGSHLYDRYEFAGSSNSVAGLNFDWMFGKINLFGEAARSASDGSACLLGSWFDLMPFGFLILVRNYDKDFHNAHGRSFGERGDVLNNEKGVYLGWRWLLSKASRISVYYDQFRHPWPRYGRPMSGSGWEIMGLIELRLRKSMNVLVRIKVKSYSDAETFVDHFGNGTQKLTERQNKSLRLQLELNPEKRARFRTRLELNGSELLPFGDTYTINRDSLGSFLYQDLRLQLFPALFFSTRWCHFDAMSYNVRFYQYENDLPGVMRLKMLYGRGTRWYFVAGWKTSQQALLSAKYEHTFYDSETSIGSGSDMILGQHENALSLQLDWRF